MIFGWKLIFSWHIVNSSFKYQGISMAIYNAQSKRKNYCGNPGYYRGWRATNRRHKKADVSVAGEDRHSTGHNLFKLLELLEPLFLPQQTATQSLALVSLVEHQTPACHTPARTSRACCMSLLNKQSILRRPEAAPDLENYWKYSRNQRTQSWPLHCVFKNFIHSTVGQT